MNNNMKGETFIITTGLIILILFSYISTFSILSKNSSNSYFSKDDNKVNATIKVRLSLTLKKYEYRNWLLPFVFSLLSLLCGIIMIIRPEIGIESITMLVGILIIICILLL